MKDESVVYEGRVKSDWIDYNDHMNDARYVQVFSQAIDNFIVLLGMDESFRHEHKVSVYTMQTVVNYLKEVGVDEPLEVTARLLEHDNKKLRLFLTMYQPGADARLATMEALLLHVDMTQRRSSPFLPETLNKIAGFVAKHRTAEWPISAGKGVSLRR